MATSSSPSPSPVRYPSGVSTVQKFQALHSFGQPLPMAYHTVFDDFDFLNPGYTATKTGNGTIALAPGSTALFTTNTSTPAAGDLAALQLPIASFNLTLGKKAFWGARIQLSSINNAAFIGGMIQTTVTPFTVTDGVYFSKLSGGALTINMAIASVITSVVIPAAAYTLVNGTQLDLGWQINRKGEVEAFVGSQLYGWMPQSGSGTTFPTRANAARLFNAAGTLPTAALNPTIGMASGTAASSTMGVAFEFASTEN